MAPGGKEQRRRAALAVAEYSSACTGEPVTEIVKRTAADIDGESSPRGPEKRVRTETPTPAELCRLVTSLLRRCGKTDEHISAVLNAVAVVDKRAGLVANRSLIVGRGSSDGVPSIVQSSCTTAAVLIDDEICNLDEFLGTLKTIVGGSPAIHVTGEVTTELGGKEGESSQQRPAEGDSINARSEAVDAMSGNPDPKDDSFYPSSEALAEVVAAKAGVDGDSNIRAANDDVKPAPEVDMTNSPSLPLEWKFPDKLSFRSMLELFLVGDIKEDGTVAVPPLRKLYPYDFEHLPKGASIFGEMCLLVKWVKEVGRKRGVLEGAVQEAGLGSGPYQYNDGKKWGKEQVDYLFEGVRPHFFSGQRMRMRDQAWTRVLENERNLRRSAKREAALLGKIADQSEDLKHAV